MTVFVNQFYGEEQPIQDSVVTSSSPFVLEASKVNLYNFNYKSIDENYQNPIDYSATKGNGYVKNLSIVDTDIFMQIRELQFTDNRNIEITHLTTDFTYSITAMNFRKIRLQTRDSDIKRYDGFYIKRRILC